MWSCQRCYYENEKDETLYCGRCGVPRYAEDPPAAKIRKLPPPPVGYFAFRKMLSPLVIRLLNLLGLLACTGAGGYYLYRAYTESFVNTDTLVRGLVILIAGNIAWRLACEILILFFSMHEVLVSIETRLSVRE